MNLTQLTNNEILRIFRAVLNLTIQEAAEKVACSEKTIRNYEHDRDLPKHKLDYCMSQLGVQVIYTPEHTKYKFGSVTCTKMNQEDYEPQVS